MNTNCIMIFILDKLILIRELNNICTQDITINGNANFNGSTFDLRRNVIFTGDVVFEGNITINALGESGIVFQNLPTAFGTNIVININRAHMANNVAVLSILRMSNGVCS